MRALLTLLLTLPLIAQLPAGTSRLTFSDHITDATFLAATGDVLWVGSILDDTIERIELDGTRTSLEIPRQWGLTNSVATGPDGALWLCSSRWIARVDPLTNELQRWPIGNGTHARSILSGPDGNVWFLQGGYVQRMRSDGRFVSSYSTAHNASDATFGSDGALYLTFPETLMRITAAGERTEFPVSPRGTLFAGTDFLWNADPRSVVYEVQRPVGEIAKISYRGETLATYRVDMSPIASDPLGNLWLRATTDEGDIVGQLTPSGVLTRFGPIPSPVATDCHPRSFGGLAFLSGGRVAMTDFYWLAPRPMVGPCVGVPRPEEAKNTITILDPRLAPVLSIEMLERSSRRRSSRH